MAEPKAKAPRRTLLDFIKDMALAKFIETFCSIYDYDTEEMEPVIPWPKQRPLCALLDISRKLFWPKARQVGGSLFAGFLAAKVAISEPNSDIYIISKTEPDAKYFLKDKVKAALNALPKVEGLDWGKWETFNDRIEFSNGSTITSLTSSENAGRGRSAVRLIIMDEAGAIEHAQQIWKAASPAIEKHPRGQMIVISNSENGSWFNRMLKKIDEGGVEGVDFHFMNVWTDPVRDEAWKKKTVTQFDNEIDFYTEYPETLAHMFLKREGYVYPTFDSKEGGKHVNTYEPDWGQRIVYGYDHGFEHYAVFLICYWSPYDDHLHVVDELFAHQKDIFDISKLILDKQEQWQQLGMPELVWKRVADTAIFAHHGQKPISELIKTYTGIQFSKSLKWNELSSTDMLRTRFTTNKITIHPRCFRTIAQVRDLLYDKHGKPRDKDNDACFDVNTLIQMKKGQKRIGEIKKGDLVKTHLGYSKALVNSFITGFHDVIEITFDDKRKIICTPNHKFLSSQGYRTITESKECYTNSSMEINISKTAQDIGNELTVGLLKGAVNYTKMFGGSTKEILTHPRIVFTIRTGIKTIIQSKILPVLRTKLTEKSIDKIELNLLRLFKTSAEPTTVPMWGESNTVIQQDNHGLLTKESLSRVNVTNVLRSSNSSVLSHPESRTISAVIIANPDLEESQELTISNFIVNFVEERLLRTNILRSVSAHYRAEIKPVKIRKLPKQPVYNFQTEDGTYYANGVIVSNCDVLRYICAELKQEAKPIKKEVPKPYSRNRYQNPRLDLMGGQQTGVIDMDSLSDWQRY